MNLQKAVWLKQVVAVSSPSLSLSLLTKAKKTQNKTRQTKKVKSLVFLHASTGRNLNPRPPSLPKTPTPSLTPHSPPRSLLSRFGTSA